MDFDTLKAIVNDGGGWDNIALLVFDNAQLWVNDPALKEPCKESDFVKMGPVYCYKEKVKFRSRKTFDYDIEVCNYHPLDHLQSVVMGDVSDADAHSIRDMM